MNDPGHRTPGQLKLLGEFQILDNKDMGEIIKESSIDDLEWFLLCVEHQLEETPHWVNNPEFLHKSQAWDRRVRTMTADILHNKRIAVRPRVWLRQAGEKLLWVAVGIAIGWAVPELLS